MVKEALTTIHFSFGTHLPEDKAHLLSIEQQAVNFFGKNHSGRNTYWHEKIGVGDTKWSIWERFYKNTGSYLDSYLQMMSLTSSPPSGLGRKLIPSELSTIHACVLNQQSYLDGIPDNQKSLALVGLFSFWELDLLDRIKQQKKLDFKMEAEVSPDKVAANQLKKLKDFHRFANDAIIAAYQGQPDLALKLYRESIKTHASSVAVRNNQYRQRLAEKIRQAVKTAQAECVFIRIGETHDVLYQEILGSSSVNAECVYDYKQSYPLPEDLLIQNLEKYPGRQLTPEEVAHALLGTLINGCEISRGTSRPERVSRMQTVINHTETREVRLLISEVPQIGLDEALQALYNIKLAS